MDETSLPLDPSKLKVIAEKGANNVFSNYRQVRKKKTQFSKGVELLEVTFFLPMLYTVGRTCTRNGHKVEPQNQGI